MKKYILATLVFLSVAGFSVAQDTITKKTGVAISAKVLEITTTEIKYKKFDNPDGPLFTILKSDVQMIRYQNGTKDIFNEENPQPVETYNLSNEEFFKRGQLDAVRYYKGYKGAGTGTFFAGLVSPLAGLIPAIACSSTTPKDDHLNYPNSTLIKQPDYYDGYVLKAKKIKKGKVWKNWWIALGINVVASIILLSGGNR